MREACVFDGRRGRGYERMAGDGEWARELIAKRGGREQRAGGRVDHGKQQQTRSHVHAAGVGEGGWAGPGGREAETQCASPGPLL